MSFRKLMLNDKTHSNPGTAVISLSKWMENVGITPCTAWRWRKKGWLKTINILVLFGVECRRAELFQHLVRKQGRLWRCRLQFPIQSGRTGQRADVLVNIACALQDISQRNDVEFHGPLANASLEPLAHKSADVHRFDLVEPQAAKMLLPFLHPASKPAHGLLASVHHFCKSGAMRLSIREFGFGFAYDGFGMHAVNPAQLLAQTQIDDFVVFVSNC